MWYKNIQAGLSRGRIGGNMTWRHWANCWAMWRINEEALKGIAFKRLGVEMKQKGEYELEGVAPSMSRSLIPFYYFPVRFWVVSFAFSSHKCVLKWKQAGLKYITSNINDTKILGLAWRYSIFMPSRWSCCLAITCCSLAVHGFVTFLPVGNNLLRWPYEILSF